MGVLNQRLSFFMAVWGHVCSRPGISQSVCSPGQGCSEEGRLKDCLAVSSACLSRTVAKVLFCPGAHRIEKRGNAKTVAKVVTVKLRGPGAGCGSWHFHKRNQNFI